MTGQTYPIRCRIRAQDGGAVTRIDVFDDIGPGGWFDDGFTAKDFTAQLAGITGPISVHVNSAGGDVFDGIAIGNAIKAHNGPKTTVVDGLAASIASVIAQAGDERVVSAGSMLMIHDAFGATIGNAAEMEAMAATLDKVSQNLADVYASRSDQGTPATWRDAMKAETWYTADEAVAAGLADRVDSGAQAELPAGLDLAAFTALPGRIAARLQSMPQAAAGKGDGEQCKTCDGTGRLKHPKTGNAGQKCPGCDGTGTLPGDSPDSEDEEGAQDRALTADEIRAIIREEIQASSSFMDAASDESAWDASKAWHNGAEADDPAAFYAGICAGKKDGDKSKQAAWALPYKYHPSDAPNKAGVENALSRLPQTEGLTNEAEAKSTLQKAMKQVNPDYEPEDSTSNHADMPAWLRNA